MRVAAQSDLRPRLRDQLGLTLQSAALIWIPNAVAFTQGDMPVKYTAPATRINTDSIEATADQAAETAGQTAEAVANQLPDWLSDNPLLLAGTAARLLFLLAESMVLQHPS